MKMNQRWKGTRIQNHRALDRLVIVVVLETGGTPMNESATGLALASVRGHAIVVVYMTALADPAYEDGPDLAVSALARGLRNQAGAGNHLQRHA